MSSPMTRPFGPLKSTGGMSASTARPSSRSARGKTEAPGCSAYGLANGARDVLAEAQPALQKKGCDVGPLL